MKYKQNEKNKNYGVNYMHKNWKCTEENNKQKK